MQRADIDDIVSRSADLVTERYLFADIAERQAALLRANLAAGRYYAATSAEELGELVTHDLQTANHDKHLRLRYDPQTIPDMTDDDAAFAFYAEQARAQMHGVAKVQWLPDNIGHLVLGPSLFHATIAGDTISAALRMLASTDALLLDLRGLRGGDPGTVALICSYLLDEPTHLNTMHDRGDASSAQSWTLPYVPGPRFGSRKPIWVLTSTDTFSGGEELAYDLQQLGRATIVGETTGGGAHARVGFTMHPHLELTIPVVRGENPISKTNWEGTGVIPDVPCTAADAFDTALKLAQQHVQQAAA